MLFVNWNDLNGASFFTIMLLRTVSFYLLLILYYAFLSSWIFVGFIHLDMLFGTNACNFSRLLVYLWGRWHLLNLLFLAYSHLLFLAITQLAFLYKSLLNRNILPVLQKLTTTKVNIRIVWLILADSHHFLLFLLHLGGFRLFSLLPQQEIINISV